MRSKSIILLALALGCGLIASIGISQVMERRTQTAVSNAEMEPVFVALHDINPSDPITPQNVKVEEWPRDKVQQGAITKLEELDKKRARQKIFSGDQIVAGKIIDENEMVNASTKIPPGFRVVAVRVDAVSGSASLVVPGDRVDVLVFLTKNPAHGINQTVTRTILQNIRVFAVDHVTEVDPADGESNIAAKTISLLVTSQQAEKVTLASELGSIRLVLRNDQEQGVVETNGTTTDDVFGSDGNSRRSEQNQAPADSKADGVAAGASSGFQNLLDLIKEQNKAKQPAPLAEVEHKPWKMMVIRGAEIDEMEIGASGIPVVIAEAGATVEPPRSPDQPALDEPQTDQENLDTTSSDPFSPATASDPGDPDPFVSLKE